MKIINVEKLKEKILKWDNKRFKNEIIEALIEEIDDESVTLDGKAVKAKYVHKNKTYIKPVEHHYEGPGEPPYIKYGCPICESLGHRFSFPNKTSNCPICNVNLSWNEEELEDEYDE